MTSVPPEANPTLPGSVLAGKYRVERIIGQGGMGVVVEARHIQLDDRVALKFLLAEYATHPEASQRFLREAQAARKIKSEHIARVTDVGTLENGAPYMVMEFLEGRDLSKMLEQGVLTIEDAVDYIIQGSDALAEAHSLGIVHRDIKPANLFLTKRANGMPLVKVLDFGISKVMNGQVDNLTRTTASMGSALYMSPEQMQQTRGVDHRTDVYALGISLYELLAGRQPFYADTLPQLCAEIFTGTPTPIRSLRGDIPEGLAAVLERAYQRDREQRYQSVAELVVSLAPYAPQRSQGAVESIARLAGVDVATLNSTASRLSSVSGLPSNPGSISSPGLSSSSPGLGTSRPSLNSGTQLMSDSSPSGIISRGGVVLGGVPANTGTGVSVMAPPPASSSSKGGVVAVIGLLAVASMVGGYMALSKKTMQATAPAAGPTVAEVAPAAHAPSAPSPPSAAPATQAAPPSSPVAAPTPPTPPTPTTTAAVVTTAVAASTPAPSHGGGSHGTASSKPPAGPAAQAAQPPAAAPTVRKTSDDHLGF